MGLPLIASPADFFPGWFDLTATAAKFRRLLRQHFRRGSALNMLGLLAIKAESRLQSGAIEGGGSFAAASGASDHRLGEFKRSVVPELDAAYNFARFLCRDPDAAQDIVQNAFLRAFRAFDNYRGGDMRAWILTIVRNCYHDWLSERRRKAGLEVAAFSGTDDDEHDDRGIEAVASSDDTPETALLRKSEAESVRLVLAILPRPLREVLVLREIEGFSYRQIADIAAVPIGTVMSRLARARKEFSEAWQKHVDALEVRS